MYILIPSYPLLVFNILNSNSNILSPFAPFFCSKLPLHFPSDPFRLVPLPPSFTRAGGEPAVSTEQHRSGGKRHVSALCQPSHRVSIWGWDPGEETSSPDRTGPKAHVEGENQRIVGFWACSESESESSSFCFRSCRASQTTSCLQRRSTWGLLMTSWRATSMLPGGETGPSAPFRVKSSDRRFRLGESDKFFSPPKVFLGHRFWLSSQRFSQSQPVLHQWRQRSGPPPPAVEQPGEDWPVPLQ